jgi:hypothetical protein
MRFPAWVRTQPKGVLKDIERRTGVGYTTLMRLNAGESITRYDVAKRISDATAGAVSVEELCEPPSRADRA